MPHFAKPEAGSWTENYPNLGTAPVDYEDSISPEHYELEREAIFKRAWLNVGRVEQLPKVGSYFTKEIDAASASIVVVRTKDDVRAFYNICRHRGNKLVWQDYPREETAGFCRQFTCKYHGWRYSLEGDLTFVQQSEEFFDLDTSLYGLKPVQCETWEGFIFVNFDESNTTPVREYLRDLGQGLEGYPFDKLTQVYKYRAEVGSNWKLFIDAFAEFYHAPILHQRQATQEEGAKLSQYGYEALAYKIDGPHGMLSSWGGQSPPKDLSMVKPIERVLRTGLFGPWDKPEGVDLSNLPPSVNPAGSKVWGVDSFIFFPNFMVLIWETGWVLTYHYWPTSHNTHIFEGTAYFAPPKNALDRLRQEQAMVTFKEYALQDGNTLEATQTMLETRVITEFPLNDQEVMLRHLHKTARDWVGEYEKEGTGA